jgi:hypothetical protein
VFGVVSIRILKADLKIKRDFNFFIISGVTCPNKGLLIDITSKHLYSGETVPLKVHADDFVSNSTPGENVVFKGVPQDSAYLFSNI